YIRMGLVEQDAANGRYDLGEFSLALGLAGLARIDSIRLSAPVLEDFCEKSGESVALAVWRSDGATCVRSVEASGRVTFSLRTGTVLPLATSAIGRTFAAFYRSPSLNKLLSAELHTMAKEKNTTAVSVRNELEVQLKMIRNYGISRTSGSFARGISGLSVPVFNHTGGMVAAICS
ncbi:MAG: IclR family transcriptional regulator, partial [Rhodanobacter sp.]